jgi:membrane protein YqaA with SNARE-associated domain
MIDTLWAYASVAGGAFLAATILPFPSEIILTGAIKGGLADKWGLVAAASIGNVLGALLNWWLGGQLRRFEGRRWFPIDAATLDAASERFQRWGVWSLLLSWVPVIGDPLTFAAGVLRVPLMVFLPLVTAGKVARYVVLAVLL